MRDPFCILGDSHVTAFLAGARAAGAGDLVVGGGWGNGRTYFDPFFDVEDGRIVPFADRTHYGLWKKKTRRDLNDCVGRLIVSMGLSATSIYNARTWDSFGVGKAPISDGLLEVIMQDLQVHVLAFYEALVERDLLAAAYFPPPPQRTHPVFTRLERDEVRSLVDRYQRPVLQFLADAKVPLIRLPVEDGEGFLRPEYAGGDPAHAGPAIGPHVAAALRALPTGSASPAKRATG